MLLIVLGPIVWALTFGRNAPPPGAEDRWGLTAIEEQIRRKNTDGRE